MGDFGEFDAICDRWREEHPGEEVPCGDLFGQWLANETGRAIIGGPLGEAPSNVAIPDPVISQERL